jgi:hypothetical protein
MATDTRPGFRLPWAGESDGATTATDDQFATNDTSVAQDGQEAEEPEMIEQADPAETTTPFDNQAAPEPTAPSPAKRATKFMAELSRAMQAAAENARAELMSRFEAEAKGVVEEVHAAATDEAAGLRRKADDDVAAIREWSKSEVARIREETDARIAARKTGLESEMEQHAGTVDARIERVNAVVAAFEAQMAAFFERLNAEEDPTRIATMAEAMPEPPSLAEVAGSIAVGTASPAAATETGDDVPAPAPEEHLAPVAAFDFAAAEAEAASFSGDLEAETDDDLPGADTEPVGDVAIEEAAASFEETAPAELATSRVVVSGLVSVANIANFKRSLSRTSGVATIGVASGPDGDFVFTVGHTLGAALSASIQELSGFDIQITGESDEAINVAAQDRDATD